MGKFDVTLSVNVISPLAYPKPDWKSAGKFYIVQNRRDWLGKTHISLRAKEPKWAIGLNWKAECSLKGNELKLIVRGEGYATNTPPMPLQFDFIIKGLPKGEYIIVPDITYKYLG